MKIQKKKIYFFRGGGGGSGWMVDGNGDLKLL